MRVLTIDNFDSFTYNLVQGLGALGAEILVFRNDAITPGEVLALSPDRILVSPGPGGPGDAGVSLAVIREVAGRIPLLGVCLGHQCLGRAFGSSVTRAVPVHGKTSEIEHNGRGLFAGIPSPMVVARYHSLVVDTVALAPDLEVTARTTDGIIMGLQHRSYPLAGIQFHPESFLTPLGMAVLENYLTDTWIS